MELTIETLTKKSHRPIVDNIVDNLVKNIDMKIQSNHESGLDSLMYELPSTFSISNMPNNDAKTIIYSDVIQRYKKKGFKYIKLEFARDRICLHISWINGLTEPERIMRNNIISQHTL